MFFLAYGRRPNYAPFSVYFGKPIKVEEIWEIPASGHWSAASPEHPVTKVREVNLLCEGAVV